MTLSAFINNQLSLENYAFTFDEIAEAYKDKAETSVNNDLKYATQKGEDYSTRLKIKNLLAHTSGIPDYFQQKDRKGKVCRKS